MNEVQRLRQQAAAAGHLKSGPQCRCAVAQRDGYWAIEPENPGIVYAPVYDAASIYGSWPYPDYPPYLFPYPAGFAFAPGFLIGFGYGVDVGFYGPLWGWGTFNWGGGNILVDPGRYSALGGRGAGFGGGGGGPAAGGGGPGGPAGRARKAPPPGPPAPPRPPPAGGAPRARRARSAPPA